MQEALSEAEKARDIDEVPIGAVMVYKNEIIARAHNQVITLNDPTAHAEILAIKQAATQLGNYRLLNTALYVTLEPCCMCAGALVHARIKRLVYAASDRRAGAAGTLFNVTSNALLNHRIKVESGLLAEPALQLIQSFFKQKRAR